MNQKEIIGKWIFKDGKVLADSNCNTIELMIKNDLIEFESDDDNWIKKNKGKKDGSIWELTYPEGHLHGGGPPKLNKVIKTIILNL
jgi:hypothetical protein|tara:strand:- start:848 stop:1105 length:258 start_codon:yes stop_codon:yes gene_type:complete